MKPSAVLYAAIAAIGTACAAAPIRTSMPVEPTSLRAQYQPRIVSQEKITDDHGEELTLTRYTFHTDEMVPEYHLVLNDDPRNKSQAPVDVTVRFPLGKPFLVHEKPIITDSACAVVQIQSSVKQGDTLEDLTLYGLDFYCTGQTDRIWGVIKTTTTAGTTMKTENMWSVLPVVELVYGTLQSRSKYLMEDLAVASALAAAQNSRLSLPGTVDELKEQFWRSLQRFEEQPPLEDGEEENLEDRLDEEDDCSGR